MAIIRTYIQFTAWYEGEKYELQTYEGEYRNLMVLLYDKIYIEGFGECKGMGRCGTCIVKVRGLPAAVNAYCKDCKALSWNCIQIKQSWCIVRTTIERRSMSITASRF